MVHSPDDSVVGNVVDRLGHDVQCDIRRIGLIEPTSRKGVVLGRRESVPNRISRDGFVVALPEVAEDVPFQFSTRRSESGLEIITCISQAPKRHRGIAVVRGFSP